MPCIKAHQDKEFPKSTWQNMVFDKLPARDPAHARGFHITFRKESLHNRARHTRVPGPHRDNTGEHNRENARTHNPHECQHRHLTRKRHHHVGKAHHEVSRATTGHRGRNPVGRSDDRNEKHGKERRKDACANPPK